MLASTSPYRRELLQRLGVAFTAEAPGVDEAAVQARGLPADALARELARQKALAVAARRPGAIVIGSDQVCALGDDVLGKPGDAAGAAAQLARLQGREHRLVTAVAVACGGALHEFADVTTLRMRPLDDAAIARYVAQDRPFDCAGSYRIERAGIALFERIDCRDMTAIIGLPLLQLCDVLRRLGVALP